LTLDGGCWFFDGYGPHTMVYSTVKLLFDHRIHAVCFPFTYFTDLTAAWCVLLLFSPTKHEFKRILGTCSSWSSNT
jgi:hypothetical protein